MFCVLISSMIGPNFSSSGGFLERPWYFLIRSGYDFNELMTEDPPAPPKMLPAPRLPLKLKSVTIWPKFVTNLHIFSENLAKIVTILQHLCTSDNLAKFVTIWPNLWQFGKVCDNLASATQQWVFQPVFSGKVVPIHAHVLMVVHRREPAKCQHNMISCLPIWECHTSYVLYF